MHKCKISIIIATYNSAKTIRRTLDSILTQTYKDWECIVVDGLSTDNTVDIVSQYSLKDERFKYISEKDRGVYDAFNKGWKMATGEWIHYLGDDDYLTPTGFDNMMKKNHDNVDVVTAHCYVIKIDGTIKPNYSNGIHGCHQGVIMRKSILEKFGGFDVSYSILADNDLIERLDRAGIKGETVDTFVAYFSMDGMSQTFSGLSKRSTEKYRLLKQNGVKYAFVKAMKYAVKDMLSISYRNIRKSLHGRK